MNTNYVGELLHDDAEKQQGHKHESTPLQRKNNREQDSSTHTQFGQDAVGGSSNGNNNTSNGIVDLSHLSDDERSRYLMNLMQTSNPWPKERELLHQMQGSTEAKSSKHSCLERLRELVEAESSLMGNFTDFPDGEAALLLSNLSSTEQQQLFADQWLCNRLFYELNSQLSASALVGTDLDLTDKLRWVAHGASSSEVEFQYIRPLLLQGGGRAKAIEAFLTNQVGLDQDIHVNSLIDQLQATELNVSKIRVGSGWFSMDPGKGKDNLDQEGFTLGDADTADRMLGIAGQKADDISEGDKKEFLKLFEENAVACTRSLLDESELAIQKEHKQVTEEGVGPIQTALSSQSGLFMGYEAIQKEQQAALGKARSSYEGADIVKRFQKRFETQEKQIRMGLVETHPVFADPNLQFVQIYDFYKNGNTAAFKGFLQQNLGEKYENIQKTRANLNEEPSMIWSLEKVIQLTAGNMPLLNDPIYHELAMQEFERRKRNDTIIRSAMAAISIGLAIASFGSMSGVSAAILGGLSVGVSGIDAYMTYQEYDQIAPAGNTTFNPEKVLTDEDPSVVWVIASVAGALADGVQLVKLAKQIATLSKVNKALELQNLEKVTAKLAGKISEKELAILNDNLHILEGLRKTRQQLAHSIVKQSKEKLDLPAIEQAVDIYMLQHSEELIKAAKSGSFKLSKEAKQDINRLYHSKLNKASAEDIIYSEGGNRIWAYYNGEAIGFYEYDLAGGVKVELNIPKLLQGKGIGKQVFREAVDGIDIFKAKWVRSDIYESGVSDNLLEFEKALKQMSETKAVWTTWTGKQAKQNGFKYANIQKLENGIEVTFTK